MTKPVLLKSGMALDKAFVRFERAPRQAEFPAASLFGGFRFRKAVWQKGELIYTKAADDLVGAYVITQLALGLKKRKAQNENFIGLLTRAEEVGFIGAIGHFDLGWLEVKQTSRPILCVSLETSRTLPGAIVGKGPVVRLGDRATVFDSGSLQVFSKLAKTILPDAHQRRIMDGGTCEATVATAYGFPAVGISIPLGNYHNQSFEGGPDSRGPLGPAPEFVHFGDIVGMFGLCHGLMQKSLPWNKPFEATVKDFRARKASYRELLALK
jgi:endoglucanase